jgi:hypothetical protein
MIPKLDLLKNLLSHLEAADQCVACNRHLPALSLIYSIIDAAGWLNSEQVYGTRKTYIDWVEQYLFPSIVLPCTALELYAARCGVVHSLAAESQLGNDGKARQVLYCWRPAPIELLESLAKVRPEPIVPVYGDDISRASV